MLQQALKGVLTNPAFLMTWGVLVAISLVILIRDLKKRNPEIAGLMKAVWIFTVVYSGPMGSRSTTTRGANRSRATRCGGAGSAPAHCYSGCGAGEIAGVFIAAVCSR